MPTGTATKLDELLEQLAEAIGEDKDAGRNVALKIIDREDGLKAVAETFRKKYLGKRTAAESAKATELEADLKASRDELAEARNQIKELEGKEPNWQRRLEDNDRKWQQKLDAEQAKVIEERSASLADKLNLEREKFRQALRIGQPGGVADLVGKYLPAEYRDQFITDPETRSIKVREIGEKDSYYDPAEGDPAEQLARDVISKLEPSARIVGDPEPGGGVTGGRPQDKALAGLVAAKRNDPLYGGGF